MTQEEFVTVKKVEEEKKEIEKEKSIEKPEGKAYGIQGTFHTKKTNNKKCFSYKLFFVVVCF